MRDNRLISVIVPVYNCAETIHSTIDSILTSGMTDYEIILVDDGSNDGSERTCDALAKEHAQIRCIHQKNAGVSAARNRGAKEASGAYIWFFDADDSVKEGSVQQIEAILRNQSSDLLVFGMEFDYYHKGRIYRTDKMLPPFDGTVSSAECSNRLYDLFISNSLSSLCNRMIKRSVLSQMNELLCDEMILYEDLEFSLRVLQCSESICFLRQAVYRYRQSEDEGSAARRLKRISHIPELLSQISEPLAGEADKDKILLSLYLTLAREKTKVSTKEEIEVICRDFKSWIEEQDLRSVIEKDDYAMLIYNGQVFRLIAKRSLSAVRHKAANRLKQTIGDFRKW